ncbi:hypothetical protein CAPTEDRAFT_81051, partial [Capitella teleta]
FKWSPGNTPITHGWNQGEPNNSGNTGEKCVSMKHGGLNDLTCWTALPYICE